MAFSTWLTRMSRGSPNSDGLARVSSSPGAYWPASMSDTSSAGSASRSCSRTARVARSANRVSGPVMRITGAGATECQASCGIEVFAPALLTATRPA